ncbi:hypothetical protein FQN54_007338 [Arachnomyces sp. PD_36]|nr:hypothetical protein FQN54_007338 [Arachnomyces sp. PD_36]
MAFLNLPDDILFLVFDDLDERSLMRSHWVNCAWLLKRFDDFMMKNWLFRRTRIRKDVAEDKVILMDPQPTESTIAFATRLLVEQVNAGHICNNPLVQAIVQGAREAALMRHRNPSGDMKDLQMRCRYALTSAAVAFGKMTHSRVCSRIELSRGTPQEIALLIASITGDVPWMRTLINSGTDVNCQDKFFGNPICLAAFGGHVPAVKLLLDYGADGNCQEQYGPSSLVYAAIAGHVSVASFLVSVAVSVTELSLSYAAAAGQAKVVALLLELDQTDPNVAFDGPLLMSIERNHPKVVEELFKRPDIDIGIYDWNRDTSALDLVAELGRESIMKIFLSHPHFDATSPDTGAALNTAASSGQVGVLQMLLDLPHIDPNYRAVDRGRPLGGGLTPLIRAAACGHDDAVRLLISHKDIDVNLMSTEAPDWQGWSPLGKAVSCGQDDVVSVFLQHPDTHVNIQQAFGWTPLIQAARDCPEMVVLLLACDRIDPNVKDFDNRGPVFHAVREGRPDILEVLLLHPRIEVHAPDDDEFTPLMLAAAGDFERTWDLPTEDVHLALVEMLLTYHEGEEPTKTHIRAALDLAEDSGCAGVSKVLLRELDSNSS